QSESAPARHTGLTPSSRFGATLTAMRVVGVAAFSLLVAACTLLAPTDRDLLDVAQPGPGDPGDPGDPNADPDGGPGGSDAATTRDGGKSETGGPSPDGTSPPPEAGSTNDPASCAACAKLSAGCKAAPSCACLSNEIFGIPNANCVKNGADQW